MINQLIYPTDPAFWEIYQNNVSGVTSQSLPSTNQLVIFCDPTTGRMQPGTMEDLESYIEADTSDDNYLDWFYA